MVQSCILLESYNQTLKVDKQSEIQLQSLAGLMLHRGNGGNCLLPLVFALVPFKK